MDAKRNDGIYVVIVLCMRVADDATGRRVALWWWWRRTLIPLSVLWHPIRKTLVCGVHIGGSMLVLYCRHVGEKIGKVHGDVCQGLRGGISDWF